MSTEAPLTPRQRRQRLRRQLVNLPNKRDPTPICDLLTRHTSSGTIRGCTSVDLEVSRVLVSQRRPGEPIALPLSASSRAAESANSAVTLERREQWLADPALKRRIDAYLRYVFAKSADSAFVHKGPTPQHVSLSIDLSWLRLRKLEPLRLRDKALASRGLEWWKPGDGQGATTDDDAESSQPEQSDGRGPDFPAGCPPRVPQPVFCEDCRIVPAELRFGAVGRSLPAVALCQHCVLLRGEERLRLIRVEQRRLVDEVDFPPEEALMSAEKKYPDYEAPPEPIKPPTPAPSNPRAAAASRLAKERESARQAVLQAEAARAAATEVCSVEAVNLSHNDLVSCAGVESSLRPFLFDNRCECLLKLDLGHNRIAELGDALTAFPNLQMLYLSHNKLATMASIASLGLLRRLEKLSLNGNPLELAPDRAGKARKRRHDYRIRVIATLPWLKQL